MKVRAAILVGLMAALTVSATAIVPVPLPDPRIPGYHFPESEATIVNWVFNLSNGSAGDVAPQAFENIVLHGWGIWAAVIRETGQVYAGQRYPHGGNDVSGFEPHQLSPDRRRGGCL